MSAHRHSWGGYRFVRDLYEPVWDVSPPTPSWSRRVKLFAALRSPWLDGALAGGADPAASAVLEYRAARLISGEHRAGLAAILRRCRESIDSWTDPDAARIPVDPEEVRGALATIGELEDALTSPAPVYCRGVAMAARIIEDGAGPLYAPRHPGELQERLRAVLAAMSGA